MPVKYIRAPYLAIIKMKILARTGTAAFPVSGIVAQRALASCPWGFAIYQFILPVWI